MLEHQPNEFPRLAEEWLPAQLRPCEFVQPARLDATAVPNPRVRMLPVGPEPLQPEKEGAIAERTQKDPPLITEERPHPGLRLELVAGPDLDEGGAVLPLPETIRLDHRLQDAILDQHAFSEKIPCRCLARRPQQGPWSFPVSFRLHTKTPKGKRSAGFALVFSRHFYFHKFRRQQKLIFMDSINQLRRFFSGKGMSPSQKSKISESSGHSS